MKNSFRLLKYAGPVIITVFSILLTFSCTNRFFVAVVRPDSTEVGARDKLKVSIDLSPNSLLENRIAIVNNSADTVFLAYPFNIVLRFSRTGMTLPAVTDYRNYVQMRYAAAKKKCSHARYPYNCSDAIDKIFKQHLKFEPFEFGGIPPGEKKEGYIAFNLPDPLNTTDQAESIAESLMSDTAGQLDGEIEINVAGRSSKPKEHRFVFPVRIITSSDENKVLLDVMKNF